MLPHVLDTKPSPPLLATTGVPDITGSAGDVAAVLGALGLFLVTVTEGRALPEPKEDSATGTGVVTL